MKKVIAPIGLVVLVLGTVIALAVVKGGKSGDVSSDKVQVVATFYPLAYAAEQVGGSAVEVNNLTSGGLEPHEFEPKARDIIAMQQAAVLLSLGDIDSWAESTVTERRAAGKPTVVIAESSEFTNHDPHIWLDPVLMKDLVMEVQTALSSAAPEQAAVFQRNAAALLTDLDLLNDDYQALTSCQRDDIIVAHDAFGYAAKRYGLVSHAVSGLSPEEEPSARDLATLADLAERLQVKTIFFESTASSSLADTLAREVGAQTAVLATLESLTPEDLAAGEDYFSLMQQNLAALKAELCR